MNLDKIIKREIFLTTLIVIGTAITFLGLTYAIYFVIDEENIGTVTFGQISFDMCLDSSCSTGTPEYGTTITGEVYPMNTTEGVSQTPYLFKITNNASQTMYAKVYAAREGVASDYTDVKLAGKVQGTSSYSYADLTEDTPVLINNIEIPAGQSKVIEVYMWLDEEATNDMMGKTISAFINAMGYQKPSDPNNLHTGDTYVANVETSVLQGITFGYTGNYQEFEAPVSGYYFIESWGAQGGGNSSYPGGKGAYTSGNIYLEKGEKLYIYVGGEGGKEPHVNNVGGYNGGGNAIKDLAGIASIDIFGGGGGATDIRYFGDTTPTDSDLVWDSTLGLNSRIMVAGGGGGAYIYGDSLFFVAGGDAGTLVGEKGGVVSNAYNVSNPAAAGGTQITGGAGNNADVSANAGSFGKGGNGTQNGSEGSATGGGGGYYGGGGTHNLGNSAESAAGGSSFISGYAGSNAITSSSSRTHTDTPIHYSNKYFKDGYMKAGVREGNGQVKIKYVGIVEKVNTNLNGVRYIKDCSNGTSINGKIHWVEVQAIKDGVNVAKGKTATASASLASGALANVTDGNIEYENFAQVGDTNSSTNYCVTVDLSSSYDLDEIVVWHRYDGRAYFNNITSVSSNNSSWTEVMNGALPSSSQGKRVSAYTERLIGYVQDGLIAWFDGINNVANGDRSTTTTTWYNLVESNKGGTITNGTWGDSYLTFNGTSTWVAVSAYNPSTVTVEAVTSTASLTGANQYIATNVEGGGYCLGVNSTGEHLGGIYGTTSAAYMWISSTGHTVTLGTKTNSSFTYDQNAQKLYTQGSEIAAQSLVDTINTPNSSTVFALGANPSGSSYASGEFFSGKMYSVRLYNRVLTPDEIYQNYLVDKERFELN